jgi:hypothetical protein
MSTYPTRPKSPSYGHALGILVLDIDCPYIPGDVGNASTFPFPVLYQSVPGVDVDRILFDPRPNDQDAVIESAKELVRRGVRGISSNCGYMIRYQAAAAAKLEIPVFLSSLLQLPMILASVGQGRSVGVIAAHSKALNDELLALAGVAAGGRLILAGMEDQPEFRRSMLDLEGGLDAERVESEVVTVAETLKQRTPNLGAILLECAVLPPYAHAVQRATGLPVYDFVTMIEYFHKANYRQSYQGYF